MRLINEDDVIKVIQGLKLRTAQQTIKAIGAINKIPTAYDLDKATNWIPISDRLPKPNTPVLVQWRMYCSDENYVHILFRNISGEWCGDLGCPNGKIIAWMPLPEPYREVDDEQNQ